MPEILRCIRNTASIRPRVSVIVPCYNHAAFLRQRLDSIFNQTYQDFEVIILDDGSPDETRQVINEYSHYPNVRTVLNEENSGSTFIQWIRGIDLARGELIWIAEDDDFCEPTLLERLVPSFEDPDVKLAYCQSVAVDETDQQLFNYTIHTDEFSTERWQADYIADLAEELNAGLAIRNTVPNASAVVFRNFSLGELRHDLPKYRLTGDWVFYIHAIRGGKVAFHADCLNYHRRHPSTCIARFEHDPLRLSETTEVHHLATSIATLATQTIRAMEKQRVELQGECARRVA
jgi:glycosyltransferase involved in cell wall biosynthesis